MNWIMRISLLLNGLLLILLLPMTSCKPDTEAPVLRLKGNDTLVTYVGAPIVEPGYIAFDKEDLDLVDQVVVSGDVDTSRVGTYHRTYTVTDAAGNSAQAVRTIIMNFSVHSLTGTYRSKNTFGQCSGLGSTQITIVDEPNKVILIYPAVGFFTQTDNYIYLQHTSDSPPQMTSMNMHLPCSYYGSPGSGTARIFNGGDSIHVFIRVTSTINGGSTYFSADYVRED